MGKHSDAKIVDIFGGQTALAAQLGVERRVVYNWTIRGIPRLGRYMIRDLARKVKVKLPAGFAP